MHRRLLVSSALVALIAIGFGCTSQKTEESISSGDVKVSTVKFDELESAIAAQKGKVVLVDFWATWCPPCVESFPKVVQKHKKYADKGLAVISVSMDEPDKAEKVLAFLDKQQATFTNLLLKEDEASEKGLGEKFLFEGTIPHAVLFDRTGKRVWVGYPASAELEDRMKAELAK